MQTAHKAPPPLDARDVIADPEPYSNLPTLYAEAWFEMKRRKGQTIDYPRGARIGPPRHDIKRPEHDPEPSPEDIRARGDGMTAHTGNAKGFYGGNGDAA